MLPVIRLAKIKYGSLDVTQGQNDIIHTTFVDEQKRDYTQQDLADLLNETAYEVMNNWGANHGAISYGHIGADLITLCSILRIPVAMHNVADKDIFRPKAWDAFGMDKEGADYRACAVYGPMYK